MKDGGIGRTREELAGNGVPLQGFPLSWREHEIERVREKTFRAGWEREAEISDDRRHEGIPHDERRLGHVAVRRPRLPCPGLQVSDEGADAHLFAPDSQSQWRAPAPNSPPRST